MCGDWILLPLAKWSASDLTEILVTIYDEEYRFVFFVWNANKISQCMKMDYACVLGRTFNTQPGISQLHLSFHLLFMENLKVSKRWELRDFSGLALAYTKAWACRLVLLYPQQSVEAFQKPQYPKYFNLQSFLPIFLPFWFFYSLH